MVNAVLEDIRNIENEISKTRSSSQIFSLLDDYEKLIKLTSFISNDEKQLRLLKHRFDSLIANRLGFRKYDKLVERENKKTIKNFKFNSKLLISNKIITYDRQYRAELDNFDESKLPRYSQKEILEILSDFTKEEILLKPILDRLILENKIGIYDENLTKQNCNGFTVLPDLATFKPYIVSAKNQTIVTAKILAHEMGHYLEWQGNKDNYCGHVTGEVLPIIYAKKMNEYIAKHFSRDEVDAVNLEFDKPIIALKMTYDHIQNIKNNKRLKLDIDEQHYAFKLYKYSLAYLTAIAKDNFNDDEIVKYIQSNNSKKKLACFGIKEEELNSDKLLMKRRGTIR